jgi:pectate lyase
MASCLLEGGFLRYFLICVIVICSMQAGITVAFPGAEGAGAVATGGRGGKVYYVTNLNDSGPGSLRDAVSGDNRIVMFQVSGTINLKDRISISGSNITVAGQTAPGDGICLRGHPLIIDGENIIVRFLRVRPGDEAGREHDALTIWGADRVMVDHCSLSWSTDSVNDVVKDSTNVTVQWCIISEPLSQSVHSKGSHGYGTGWGSGPQAGNSFHHNLLAHCNSRSPRLGSEKSALLDVRNNVIYNMGEGWAYGGEHARVNYIGNYYRPGPSTTRPDKIFRVSNPNTRMFLRGNMVDGHPEVDQDNTRGLIIDDGVDREKLLVSEPFDLPHVATGPAEVALEEVLQYSGTVMPSRDAVDRRIVDDVRNRTGKIINSQNDVGGWPELKSGEARVDSDQDGLPDEWETARALDPQDPSNAQQDSGVGSDLDRYLHELATGAFPSPVAKR